VDDLRESPAVEVARLLAQAGAKVRTYEPFAPETTAHGCAAVPSLSDALIGAEAVVLLVAHGQLLQLDPAEAVAAMSGRVAVDCCGAWDREAWKAAGFQMHVLGVGQRRV